MNNKERNYGCRIWDNLIYQGFKSLIMENEKLQIMILIDKGTDIIKFLYKPDDIDFMWQSPLGLRNPQINIPTSANASQNLSEGGFFHDYYEGGWQEIFPTAGPPCIYKGAEFGLHGEVWGLSWNYEIIKDSPKEIEVKFWVRTYKTPFYLEKTLSLKSQESVLKIREKVINEGEEEMDFMWGHHLTLGVPFLDEHCIIDIPAKRVEVPAEVPSTSRLKPNVETDWPYVLGKNNARVDLSKIPAPDVKIADLVFIKDLEEGKYAIINKKKKIKFGLKWDKKVFPYIWFWQVYKGAFGYPWYGRTYNIGLELFSSIPGGLLNAIKRGTQLKLKPQETIETEFFTTVENLEKGEK